jgi:hypothetical protein
MTKCVFVLALWLASLSAGAQQGSILGGGLGDLWRLQPGVSRRASTSAEPWTEANNDAWSIPPGETVVLADLKGPGMITHLWNTISSEEPFYARLLVLRIYWDGEAHPSVEAPVGDFFGVGHGLDIPFDSLPVRVTSGGKARNCYWRMPFGESARITVTNEGWLTGSIYSYVDWVQLTDLPPGTPYFHAMYRQEHPALMGQRYLLADITGRGHYVGTLLNIRARYDAWYGEGDDFFFIDGDEAPTLKGTGTEDYFGDAWGFREQHGPFYGATKVQMYEGGYNSFYRWHIADPIIFRKSLRAEIEHTGFPGNGEDYQERDDDFSSVAYWYQQEPHVPWPDIPKGYGRLFYDSIFESVLDREISEAEKARLLQQAFLEKEPVAIEPVWNDGPLFKGAQARVLLRNGAGIPVTVRGVVNAHAPVQAEPVAVELVLAPGEERTVEVGLSVVAACPIPSVAPVLTDWTFGYALEDQTPVEVIQRSAIIIEGSFTVPYRKRAVVVDGQLDEWDELPHSAVHPGQLRIAPTAWEGPEDCSFRFAVAQDDDYLYLAVETTDDVPFNEPDRLRWFQDGIEVRVDARPDPERSNWNMWGGEFEKFLFLAMLPGDTPEQHNLFNEGMLPEGVEAVCVRTERGHNAEIIIPHAALDAYRGGRWDVLRINMAINDLDLTDGKFVQYWWRPDWRDKQNYPGSGTFSRN